MGICREWSAMELLHSTHYNSHHELVKSVTKLLTCQNRNAGPSSFSQWEKSDATLSRPNTIGRIQREWHETAEKWPPTVR